MKALYTGGRTGEIEEAIVEQFLAEHPNLSRYSLVEANPEERQVIADSKRKFAFDCTKCGYAEEGPIAKICKTGCRKIREKNP